MRFVFIRSVSCSDGRVTLSAMRGRAADMVLCIMKQVSLNQLTSWAYLTAMTANRLVSLIFRGFSGRAYLTLVDGKYNKIVRHA